ncbi:hypothetical protein HYDPIDRAFT_27347 [Hydnomerulius pinastri MD-312]|nr:hypothetical protein HYDPIDRAFT_27347 [Hydnomerulius pinastri MD-312]
MDQRLPTTYYPASLVLSSLAKHQGSNGASATTHPRQRNSSVSKLPIELLIQIFEDVHLTCCEKSSRSHGTNDTGANLAHPTYETSYDPCSPSLFPYNVAAVCQSWKDIVCSGSFPAFWTRVVVVVGLTTPQMVVDILSWSGGLPLGVSVITCGSSWAEQKKAAESTQAEAASAESITRLILPHIKRIRSLRYFLSRSSSLAAARRVLRGKARMLEAFVMECEEDDGEGSNGVGKEERSVEDLHEDDCGWKLITHAVQHLRVDNYTFKPACYPKSDGFNDLYRLRSITLSWPKLGCVEGDRGLRRSGGRIRFREFMAVLQEAPDLTWLTVRNERFEGLDADGFVVVYDLPSLRSVTLEGVSAPFTTLFFHSINADIDSINVMRGCDGAMFSEGGVGSKCHAMSRLELEN